MVVTQYLHGYTAQEQAVHPATRMRCHSDTIYLVLVGRLPNCATHVARNSDLCLHLEPLSAHQQRDAVEVVLCFGQRVLNSHVRVPGRVWD